MEFNIHYKYDDFSPEEWNSLKMRFARLFLVLTVEVITVVMKFAIGNIVTTEGKYVEPRLRPLYQLVPPYGTEDLID